MNLQRPAHRRAGDRIDLPPADSIGAERDLDNVATKAVLDLLTAHGAIEDDTNVVKINAYWDTVNHLARCGSPSSRRGDGLSQGVRAVMPCVRC